jgi:hypothetical protein
MTRFAVVALASLLSLLQTGSPVRAASPPIDPREFIGARDVEVVAIVETRDVERRWVILESDGDHVPLVVSTCEMVEPLAGASLWPVGKRDSLMQFDYTEMISGPISPPAMPGRRYLLFADRSPAGSEVPAEAPWTAHLSGMLLLRGDPGQEFIYTNGTRLSLAGIRKALAAGPVPLALIADPRVRLQVAERRLDKGRIGDPRSFLDGVVAVARDPEGQAKHARSEHRADEDRPDALGLLSGADAHPYGLWVKSLELIEQYGEVPAQRDSAVAALQGLLGSVPESRRLGVALALVELGSDAGRDVLVHALARHAEGQVLQDPDSGLMFPGRFPHGESAPAAAAHALGRLGDRQGLAAKDIDVRLAAAEALVGSPDASLRSAVESIAQAEEPEIDRLRKSGELAAPRKPGDHTRRYPELWVRARGLLARLGDDASLKGLVEGLLVDMSTYPHESDTLAPSFGPVQWTTGRSLFDAIAQAGPTPQAVAVRVRRLSLGEAHAKEVAGLLKALEAPPAKKADDRPTRPAVADADIEKRLASHTANERAQGWAAAGLNQRETFYDRVLETAQREEGVERMAAIYSLGFYRHEPPEAALRAMVRTGSMEARQSAIELATRRRPERFAAEAMAVVRDTVAAPKGEREERFEHEHALTVLARVLARLAPALPPPVLDGLHDPNPGVRRVVVDALCMGGNPVAARALADLADDRDEAVRVSVRRAIETLGPEAP